MHLSKLSVVLGFLKNLPDIDKIVVGVLNEEQFDECEIALNANILDEIDYKLFECNELSIINPSLWGVS